MAFSISSTSSIDTCQIWRSPGAGARHRGVDGERSGARDASLQKAREEERGDGERGRAEVATDREDARVEQGDARDQRSDHLRQLGVQGLLAGQGAEEDEIEEEGR